MTYAFNVDRFYAQLGVFSIFVISHERWVKLGSNWISCSVNSMLTDFWPNWAFCFIFVIFGWGVKGQNKSNSLTMSNGKTNGANMLALGKHAKVSTVTCLSDLRLRDQRSKKGQIRKYCYISSMLHTMIVITSLWYTYGTLIGPNVVLTLVMVPGP